MGIFVFIVYSLGNFVQNAAEVPLTSSFPINSTNLLQDSTHKFILSYLQLEKGLPEVLNNFYVYILLGCQGIHAAEKYLPGHYTASLDGRCPSMWPKEMRNYPKYASTTHPHTPTPTHTHTHTHTYIRTHTTVNYTGYLFLTH